MYIHNIFCSCYCFSTNLVKLWYLFRVVHPLKSNTASKFLSDSANEYNRKKLRVNAQVTAMMSFLELFGMLATVLTVRYFTKANTFFLVVYLAMLYGILLPNAFLINTSQNKNKIIELGWTKVLRNVLSRKNNVIELNEDIPADPHRNKTTRLQQAKVSTKPNIHDISSTGPGLNNLPSKSSCTTDAFLHSNKQQALKVNLPVTGKTSPDQDNEYKESMASSSLDVNRLVKPVRNHEGIQLVIFEMINCIEEEDKYLKYFKKLLALYDDSKAGINTSYLEVNNEFLSNSKPAEKSKTKKQKGKGKRSILVTKKSSLDKPHICHSNEIQEKGTSVFTIHGSKSQLKKRSITRTEILTLLESSLSEEMMFKCLMERLTDFEEHNIS